jgi:hypothetical protein
MGEVLEFRLRVEYGETDRRWTLIVERPDDPEPREPLEFDQPLDLLAYLEALGRWPPGRPGLK